MTVPARIPRPLRPARPGSGPTARQRAFAERAAKTVLRRRIMNGLTTVKGQYSGQEASGQYRVTQMLVRRDGRWQIVALQMTPITTTTPAEKKP